MNSKKQVFLGTGRRKEAVARVRMTPGTGKFEINDREPSVHFTLMDELVSMAFAPLKLVGAENSMDIVVLAHGGGLHGQAASVSLGIARALLQWNATLRPTLRAAGMLTRDPRMRERLKPGRPGARKRFQFSKR